MTTDVQCVVLEDIAEAYDYARLTPEARMVLGEVCDKSVRSLDDLLETARLATLSASEVHLALRSLCVERRIRKDSDQRYYVMAEGQRVLEKVKQIKWVVEGVTVSQFQISDTAGSLMPSIRAILVNVDNKENTANVELAVRPYEKIVALMPKARAVDGRKVAISSAIFNTLKQIVYWRDNA